MQNIQEVSKFKDEYLDIEIHGLVDGEVTDLKLRQYLGKFVAILVYGSDFTALVREEILEIIDRIDDFHQADCQVQTTEMVLSHTR